MAETIYLDTISDDGNDVYQDEDGPDDGGVGGGGDDGGDGEAGADDSGDDDGAAGDYGDDGGGDIEPQFGPQTASPNTGSGPVQYTPVTAPGSAPGATTGSGSAGQTSLPNVATVGPAISDSVVLLAVLALALIVLLAKR